LDQCGHDPRGLVIEVYDHPQPPSGIDVSPIEVLAARWHRQRGNRDARRYMGHSKIAVTMDLHGHLMPGNESEAAGLLDAYLAAQQNQAAIG
jgi:hypothetical protein